VSQENVEIVVKQLEDTTAGDFVSVMDAYREDVTLVLHGDLLSGGDSRLSETVAGKGPVGEWFGDWFRQFGPGYRFEIEESRSSGERVFLVATHHARGRISGAPVARRSAYVYTIHDGKVARVEVWGDRQPALEAAGLSE
jgi:ketosteroid isomerase-like protein